MESPMTKWAIKPNEASNIRTPIFLLLSLCAEPAGNKEREIREREREGTVKGNKEREGGLA